MYVWSRNKNVNSRITTSDLNLLGNQNWCRRWTNFLHTLSRKCKFEPEIKNVNTSDKQWDLKLLGNQNWCRKWTKILHLKLLSAEFPAWWPGSKSKEAMKTWVKQRSKDKTRGTGSVVFSRWARWSCYTQPRPVIPMKLSSDLREALDSGVWEPRL